MHSYSIVVSSVWLVSLLNVNEVLGHGMLIEPINRGSMWRKGYSTPINYDDSGNFCGGYMKQWSVNEGKCGLCGDDYSLKQPRPNEHRGTYGTGIVVATYEQGTWVNLTVLITANHRGFFRFDICPAVTDGPDEIETEDCFAEYPLTLEDGSNSYTLPSLDAGTYTVRVKLPDALTCDRCVLRWEYTTGNNWGVCDDDEDDEDDNNRGRYGALGCGPQETFRTCSDISIV